MKNTKRTLPILLFPYVYLTCLAGLIIAVLINPEPSKAFAMVFMAVFASGVACTIWAFVSSILILTSAIKGKTDAAELSKLNMTIKLVHIPAYVINFVLGVLGLMMSVWGIPLFLWAIFIDVVTVTISGIVGVAANVRGKNESLLTTAQTVWFSILGFVYCVDVVIAIVLNSIVKKKTKE